MKDKWLKAATIGSIWASFEIIIGSFLHNVRLPFAGTILSFVAVMLMVAFLRLWPMRGILWRAALICALMKSISPSAVILGPMTGIFLEGILLEFSITLLGINAAGMIVGGMLAVFSALIHKAVNLLILYGWDLARLLDKLVVFATKQLGMSSVGGREVLIILTAVYLISGAIAAVSGRVIGRRTAKIRETGTVFEPISQPGNTLFEFSDSGRYSALLLGLHLMIMTTLLIVLMRLHEWWVFVLPVPYLAFCFIRYRRSLRQFFRPKLWIQLVLIAFLASVFLAGIQSGHWFSKEGLQAGLLMNLRALLMLTGFSAISSEMKNPVIRTILYTRGFAPLYRSLSMAFAVLPEIIGSVSDKHRRLKGITGLLEMQLLKADHLYERIRLMGLALPTITLISGDRGEGKTAFLLNRVKDLMSRDISVCGFVAEGIHTPEGNRNGYRIININTGETAEFCMQEGPDHWERVGRFRINPEGLARGYEWLDQEKTRIADVLVIDELGPLEMAGRGWAPLIERILREDPKPMIWTVRTQLARKIAHKWNVGNVEVIDIAQEE